MPREAHLLRRAGPGGRLGISAGDLEALGLMWLLEQWFFSSWLIFLYGLCVLVFILGLCFFSLPSPSKLCPENGALWSLPSSRTSPQLQISLLSAPVFPHVLFTILRENLIGPAQFTVLDHVMGCWSASKCSVLRSHAIPSPVTHGQAI